jgi:hypothetical protein
MFFAWYFKRGAIRELDFGELKYGSATTSMYRNKKLLDEHIAGELLSKCSYLFNARCMTLRLEFDSR